MANSPTKFYLSNYLLDFTIHDLDYVSNYYVYAWLDKWKVFYIGMGRNRRAWNEHLPPPEKRRAECEVFRVRILRHNLTKQQAHLIERYYIDYYQSRGFELFNQRIPKKLRKQ